MESFQNIHAIEAADYWNVLDVWHSAAETMAYLADTALYTVMKHEDPGFISDRNTVRDEAIEFSSHLNTIVDIDELMRKYEYFMKMGVRYGLTDEFAENCII